MYNEDNILHLEGFLSAEQITGIDNLLAKAPFVDGRATATDAAKLVKNNLQVDANDRVYQPQLQQIVGTALMSNVQMQESVFPMKVYPFLFSKYGEGMTYGWHVDSPVMGPHGVRTDLAMTIFLSEPSAYAGGELEIRTAGGERAFKPAKGDAVVYPCNYVHRVAPVTKGERRVAVTWVQSIIRSPEQRRMLFDSKRLHTLLSKQDPLSEETQLALQNWSNLMRMWAEI